MIALHDAESAFDGKTPLEASLPRPPSFHVYGLLMGSGFSNERVFLPYGLEDPTNRGTIEAGAAEMRRPEAPFPATLAGAATPRQQGAGLKVTYSAFLAASFVTYYDSRITPRQFLTRVSNRPSNEMIASSLLAELKHAAEVAATPANALGRGTRDVPGPHESQRSRRVAATLLLPRALSGKTRANSRDVAFLNAFALIATSTNRAAFSIDAQGMPQSPETGGAPAIPLTNAVRMSVLAGSASVAAFAKTLGIASEPPFATETWKQHAMICFSYLVDGSVVHSTCVLDDSTSSVTTARFASIVQNTALRAQITSDGQLVLPPGFVSPEHVVVEDDAPGDEPEAHFLRLQAEKQREFQRLHLHETSVDVFPDVVKRLDFDFPDGRKARFVRVCSNTSRLESLCDERHCPGILFSSNEELLVEYLHRNRLEYGQRNPLTREWPPFGLSPPLDDERKADVSILWFRIETQAVGSKLNVFFPRVLMGQEVTDASNSRIFAVVPTLCAVGAVVCSGNFVLPCTAKSMMPTGRSELSSRLYGSFCKAVDESFDYLRGGATSSSLFSNHPLESPLRICHAASTTSLDGERRTETPSSPTSQADDDLVAALMGCKLGHPASTCGDAYELLQDHTASENTFSRAFHSLVATGVSALGPHASMQTLMDEAACALADRLSIPAQTGLSRLAGGASSSSPFGEDDGEEGDRKRSRTPNGVAVRSSPPPLSGSLRQASHESGLSEVSDATATLAAPRPLARQDSLQRHWLDNANLKRLAALGGMRLFALPDFENGEVYATYPLTMDGVEDLLDGIWKALGVRYDVYEAEYEKERSLSERNGVPPTSLSPYTCVRAFEFVFDVYAKVLSGVERDVVDEFEVFAILRAPDRGEATLYVATSRSDGGIEFVPTITDALFQPCEKLSRVLFSITQEPANTSSPGQVTVNCFRAADDGRRA